MPIFTTPEGSTVQESPFVIHVPLQDLGTDGDQAGRALMEGLFAFLIADEVF